MNRIIALVLCIIMLFSGTSFAMSLDLDGNYSVNETYQYPIVPGTDEWNGFQSLAEMIEVCQIPEDILKNISTEDLIKTVINYPLAINMLVYDRPQQGFKSVYSYFNGLQELMNRHDGVTKMEEYLREKTLTRNSSQIDNIIANVIYTNLQVEKKMPLERPTRMDYHYNYTPNGTKIKLIYNLTWADHGLTASAANSYNEQLKTTYSNATPVREEDPAYNCHSYAWYTTSSSNLYWMQNAYAVMYMTDGSYTEVTSPSSGDKVWYGSADHSAIVRNTSGNDVTVRSKWGSMGLFEHSENYSPYSANDISYWR